jgi:pyruvate/2-oxoglutarate dehydrogenase complex dihydrolipoamide acyltransferase (E2) component
MPTDVLMPKLADTLVEGTLARWLKAAQESVQAGEAIAEIETDKVTTELIAPSSGTLSALLVKEGETVPIGTPLVRILAVDDNEVETSRSGSGRGRGDGVLAPPAVNGSPSVGHSLEGDAGGASAPTPHHPPLPPLLSSTERTETKQHTPLPAKRASPLASRIAHTHGIDLAQVETTSGRITRADVEQHLSNTAKPVPSASPSLLQSSRVESSDVGENTGAINRTPTRLGKAMAARMTLVRQVPTGTAVVEADITDLEQSYKREREGWLAREGFPLTYTPYFLHALAQSLKAWPAVRVVWHDGKPEPRDAVHLGVAVALDEGLIVPVLRDADQQDIPTLARTQAELVARTRSRHLRPEDVSGGIATLTNVGTMGGLLAFPMLNEQQSIILGIGTITHRAVGSIKGISYRSHVYLSLTFDRRVLADLQAERFLLDVARRINT